MSYDFVKLVEDHGVFVNATPGREHLGEPDRWVCNYCGDQWVTERSVPTCEDDIIEHLKDYHSKDLESDGEKLISVIPKDMETKVNLAKNVMTKLMVEYDELIEERTAIYWKVQKTQHGPMQQDLLQTLNDVQKKLDAKIIELENLWREI